MNDSWQCDNSWWIDLVGLVLVLLLAMFIVAYPLQGQVVRVPTKALIEELPLDSKRKLELFANLSIEEALDRGYYYPGQELDFGHPYLRFVVRLNDWIETVADNQILRGSRNFYDAAEVIKRNKAQDDWVEFRDRQDAEYKKWKEVRKAGEKLLRR